MFDGDKGQYGNYYYKRNDAYVEILVEKIADLFDIKHAHYYPVKNNNQEYYLSIDLNCFGKFVLAEDLGINSNNIYEILNTIKSKYPIDYDNLGYEFIKMFFMDLLILNIDRSNTNYGFLTTNGKTSLYILDNELSFLDTKSYMTSLDNNPIGNSLLEIENILNNFPTNYIDLFQEMVDKLDIETLANLFKETESIIKQELPHKNNYLKRYDLLRWRIKEKKLVLN